MLGSFCGYIIDYFMIMPLRTGDIVIKDDGVWFVRGAGKARKYPITYDAKTKRYKCIKYRRNK